jgi:hypothetical protein
VGHRDGGGIGGQILIQFDFQLSIVDRVSIIRIHFAQYMLWTLSRYGRDTVKLVRVKKIAIKDFISFLITPTPYHYVGARMTSDLIERSYKVNQSKRQFLTGLRNFLLTRAFGTIELSSPLIRSIRPPPSEQFSCIFKWPNRKTSMRLHRGQRH